MRLCRRATSGLGSQVRMVAVPREQSPAKANGSPPSTVKRKGWRGCFLSSALSHS